MIGGRYEVECELGAGAVGAVYLAKHKAMDLQVAIKVLHQEHAERISLNRRFEREAKMASQLDHPNIVRVTDFGRTEAGVLYMVTEFINGRTLAQRLQHGSISLEESLDVIDQMLDALEYAHEQGVVHRDIKPANMMLVEREGMPQVKLLDFGLARPTEQESTEETALTREGAILGTPLYMSPEQGLGDVLDARTDLYSVGVVLFQLLEGEPPFVRNGAAEVIRAHITESIPELNFEAPRAQRDALERIIHKALAKKPEERFTSATEFRQALLDSAERPKEVTRSLPAPVSDKPRWGLKVTVGLVAAVLLILVGAAGVIGFSQWRKGGGSTGSTLAEAHALLDTDFRSALKIYRSVLKEEPWTAESKEFLSQVSRLTDDEARGVIRIVDRHAGKYANTACKAYFERRMSSTATKRSAYECLYKHDGLTKASDSLDWLVAEMAAPENQKCGERAWYAEQLARRSEPRAVALLDQELKDPKNECFRERVQKMRLQAKP